MSRLPERRETALLLLALAVVSGLAFGQGAGLRIALPLYRTPRRHDLLVGILEPVEKALHTHGFTQAALARAMILEPNESEAEVRPCDYGDLEATKD